MYTIMYNNNHAKKLLFTCEYLAYVMKFIQCRHRRQVVYVCADNLVAHLREHRIIELEK